MSVFTRLSLLSSIFVLSACGASAPATELPPQPPMWIVSDADSEITLYPTLHLLPKEIVWKSDELIRRLSEAEEVWFEIMPGAEKDITIQEDMLRLGMRPGESLSKNLSPNEVEILKNAIKPLGTPFSAVDQMRPWLVSTLVSASAMTEAGFDPNEGVEKHLSTMAAGKKIKALETAVYQMEMLASIPENIQIEILRDTLNELDEGVDELRGLAAQWALGDVEDMEDELIDEMKSETPKAYDIVFTQRNQNWADQIEIEMKGSGTDFIAVGAGHLVGEDSVPAMLKARGYNVKRL